MRGGVCSRKNQQARVMGNDGQSYIRSVCGAETVARPSVLNESVHRHQPARVSLDSCLEPRLDQ